MKANLTIRPIEKQDCQIISDSFRQQGWNKPLSQYKQYVEYQITGARDVLIAEWNQEFAGYLTCLLYTSPSPRDKRQSRMPSSA